MVTGISEAVDFSEGHIERWVDVEKRSTGERESVREQVLAQRVLVLELVLVVLAFVHEEPTHEIGHVDGFLAARDPPLWVPFPGRFLRMPLGSVDRRLLPFYGRHKGLPVAVLIDSQDGDLFRERPGARECLRVDT